MHSCIIRFLQSTMPLSLSCRVHNAWLGSAVYFSIASTFTRTFNLLMCEHNRSKQYVGKFPHVLLQLYVRTTPSLLRNFLRFLVFDEKWTNAVTSYFWRFYVCGMKSKRRINTSISEV